MVGFGFLLAVLVVNCPAGNGVLAAASKAQQRPQGLIASVRWFNLDLTTVNPLVCPPVNTFSLLVHVVSELEMLKAPP